MCNVRHRRNENADYRERNDDDAAPCRRKRSSRVVTHVSV